MENGREHTTANAVASFYSDLREAFQAAGPPTYSRLVAILQEQQHRDGGRALGSSALQSMMSGRNRTLPKWEVLSPVIRALRAHAQRTNLDPEAVGGLPRWHTRLRAAEAAVRDGRPPGRHEGSWADLSSAARDEDHPDHGRAAYELAVLALCKGDPEDGTRWLSRSACAPYQPARLLLSRPDRLAAARRAAQEISDLYLRHGDLDRALVFRQAAQGAPGLP